MNNSYRVDGFSKKQGQVSKAGIKLVVSIIVVGLLLVGFFYAADYALKRSVELHCDNAWNCTDSQRQQLNIN